MPGGQERIRRAGPVVVLAVLAYVPALLSSPGRMPADTKLYLYLDPGRLISDAPWTFDARQFAGWVPHQVIAYLWPQGPWFWLGETAGLPDWVTHRLWLATLFLAAGTGVLWAARRMGLGPAAALVAALVYQLSPYVLPYVSRTSAMLLPWAGLGWIVGLTARAATRGGWRHAALAALVVASVGAVNATALMMIVPAPVLWLVLAAADGSVTWRRAAATAGRIGSLSLVVSLWWIVMVVIQGRHGADVLAYSESLESVSFTSTSTEVWRGLGYWLTYVRDPYAATTTAGADYMVSRRVIVAGFGLLLVAVAGLVATRWRHRRFAVACVVVGIVLGVGVHPFDDPSPLMRVLLGDGTSGAGLALRSSTRAVPVLLLGLGLGAGALVDAVGSGRRVGPVPLRPAVAAGLAVVAVANLPALVGRDLVDPALARDESPPAAWRDAAAALDAEPAGFRVLQVPGAEFGAFRWGYTVDPPLPGLTDRPLVTRDLLPLGSAAAMDLLYALDDRFQAGTIEAAAIAPVSRLLGADTIWVTGDAAFDRFRTPRPELVHDFFAAQPPGLGDPVPFGPPTVNRPDIPVVDEQAVSDDRVGTPVPPVELVPVEDPVAVVRAKAQVAVVVGSGDGVVDAAAAGLLDGHELIRYSGALAPAEREAAAAEATSIIVTDSNRARAHHWRSSQDVTGLTESPGQPDTAALTDDVADERLPVFTADTAGTTTARQDGPVRAAASGYGEPFAYRPEQRPVMAIDGDPATAWVVADRAPARGHSIRLTADGTVDHVTLLQPAGAATTRHVTEVSIALPGRPPRVVPLDERSFTAPGQRVDIDPVPPGDAITIGIADVAAPDPTPGPALAAVGFAEIDVGLGPTVEVVVPPDDLLTTTAAGDRATYVFSRLRTRPTDRWRSDPEPTLVREVELPAAATFTPAVTVRLDQRAGDEVLAGLLGIEGATATARLTGVARAGGWAATDGDPATAWVTPFGAVVGAGLDVVADAPVASLRLTQPAGDHSRITRVRVTADATSQEAPVPAPDAAGTSTVVLADATPAGPVRVEVAAVDEHRVVDRRYAEPVVAPAAIAELDVGPRTTIPAAVDTGCRDDLLTVDGVALPLRVQAPTAALLTGDAVPAVPCGSPELALDAGRHLVRSSAGAVTGLHVDRLVLTPASSPTDPPVSSPAAAPAVTVTSADRTSRTVTVDACPDGCWLVLGEGFHEAWAASIDGRDLGPPQLVDGGFNGWRLEPSAAPTTVRVRWTAQTPLTAALVVSVLGVLACIALAAAGGRSRRAAESAPGPPAGAPPRFDPFGAVETRRRLAVVAVAWTVAAGLLVAPVWAVAGAAGGAVLVAAGRPRLAGYAAIGMLAYIAARVVVTVHRHRPPPDAGWPARFEHLHRLGLFAAVTLAVAATGRVTRPGPGSGDTPTSATP